MPAPFARFMLPGESFSPDDWVSPWRGEMKTPEGRCVYYISLLWLSLPNTTDWGVSTTDVCSQFWVEARSQRSKGWLVVGHCSWVVHGCFLCHHLAFPLFTLKDKQNCGVSLLTKTPALLD